MPSPAGPPTATADPGPAGGGPPVTEERRSLLVAGAAFFGILVVLIAVAAVFAGGSGDEHTPATTTEACPPDDAACLAAQRSVERPGIIPKPGEGHAPRSPGDRGGWEQVAVFGALVVGLAAIMALVIRSGRRARARGSADPGT